MDMLNKHLTFLAPMLNNQPVLFNGKLIHLTEKFKVVCAHNPKEYGGGREAQKLFTDYPIPQLIFDQLPLSVILEKIVKPIVKQDDQTCHEFMVNYFADINPRDKNYCVRHLEESLIRKFSPKRKDSAQISL